MIKIHLYKCTHQNGIDEMMRDIANEFVLPISNENKSKHQSLDKYWVAMNNNEIVGTIGIYKIGNTSSTLKNMFVKKEYRGSAYGVAQSLFSRVYDWCNSEHIEHIYLGTMSQFKAAQKFYEKNQFKKIPKNKLPKNFRINPVDDIFYIKIVCQINENRLNDNYQSDL